MIERQTTVRVTAGQDALTRSQAKKRFAEGIHGSIFQKQAEVHRRFDLRLDPCGSGGRLHQHHRNTGARYKDSYRDPINFDPRLNRNADAYSCSANRNLYSSNSNSNACSHYDSNGDSSTADANSFT